MWPVDVLLIPEKRMALIRHNESCSVQRVELMDTCGTRDLKLDTRLLDSMHRSPLTFGTADTLGTRKMNRPQPRLGSRNIKADGIKGTTSLRPPMRPNLQALKRQAFGVLVRGV